MCVRERERERERESRVIAESVDEGSERTILRRASAKVAAGRVHCTCCFPGMPLRASALLPAA